MIDEARHLSITMNGEIIINVRDLSNAWLEDSTVKNGKKIWTMVFGMFDLESDWE